MTGELSAYFSSLSPTLLAPAEPLQHPHPAAVKGLACQRNLTRTRLRTQAGLIHQHGAQRYVAANGFKLVGKVTLDGLGL